MRAQKLVTLAAAMLTLALIMGACGSASDAGADPAPPAAGAPESPVGSTPGGGGDDAGSGAPQPQEPRSGLVDVRPRPWDKAKVIDGGRALKVFYFGSVEECGGLDHVQVESRRKAVEVTLLEGRDPDADVCIEMAVSWFTTVELDERVGGRKIVDGAPDDL